MANRSFRISTSSKCSSCLHGKNIYEEDAGYLATLAYLAYLHTRPGPLKLAVDKIVAALEHNDRVYGIDSDGRTSADLH
jgi:hypothetical protein